MLAASLFATQPPASKSSNTSSSSSAADAKDDPADDTDDNQQSQQGPEGFTSEDPSSGFNISSSSSSAAAKGTVELVSPGGGRSDLAEPLVLGSTGIMTSARTGRSSSFGGNSSSSGGSIVNVKHASARTADDASVSVLNQLRPQNEWEWRAMLAVAAVRFVLLPCASLVLVLGVSRAGLLPPDPVCAFMLLLQSCMPPGGVLELLGSCRSRLTCDRTPAAATCHKHMPPSCLQVPSCLAADPYASVMPPNCVKPCSSKPGADDAAPARHCQPGTRHGKAAAADVHAGSPAGDAVGVCLCQACAVMAVPCQPSVCG